jgi:hypothetical protein
MSPAIFTALCRSHGLPFPFPEARFHPTRRWRFDWSWPQEKIALEINGGVWRGGRHNTGKGYLGELEKLNEAQILGWKVIQVTPDQVKSGEAFAIVKRAMEGCKA